MMKLRTVLCPACHPRPSLFTGLGVWRILGWLALAASPVTAGQLTLTWQDTSTNEDGFKIERTVSGGTFGEIASVGANTTTFTDLQVAPGATYTYRVYAYNAAGQSEYSNLASGAVPPVLGAGGAPTLTTIANQSITVGTSTATLSFTLADVDTPVQQLGLTVSSTDSTLLPSTGIVLGGSGASRTIRVTPAAGRTGTATVRILANDGTATGETTFVVTVASAVTIASSQPSLVLDGELELSSSMGGSGFTHQWLWNGTPIAGATGRTFTIPSLQRFHAGSYAVRVTSNGTVLTSDPFVVSPPAPASSSGRLLNLSARAVAQSGDRQIISGFVVAPGGNKRLLLRSSGPTLGQAPFNLAGVLPNPRMVLNRWNGVSYLPTHTNLDWGNNSNVAGIRDATAAVFAFGLQEAGRDAALLVDLAPGQYTVVTGDENGTSGIGLFELYDTDEDGDSAPLTNLSTRGFVGVGEQILITGFVISGTGTQTLLVRGVGPGLALPPYNVTGTLANPAIEIYRRNSDATESLILTNDDWSNSTEAGVTAQMAADLMAFPLAPGSLDAALVATLSPGVYTVFVRGAGAGNGVALAEVYAAP